MLAQAERHRCPGQVEGKDTLKVCRSKVGMPQNRVWYPGEKEVIPMGKSTYRSVEIQKVTAAQILAAVLTPLVIFALDVAKKRVLSAIADDTGKHALIVHFALPTELGRLIALAEQLVAAGRRVQIAMEPTGSYSSPILEAAHGASLETFLISPKRAHDAAEVYDGVPSKHDPKDATILARLHAQGISTRWAPMSQERRELRALMDERELYAAPLEEHFGRVEARLAHWWPALLQSTDVRQRISVLRWLTTYADPATVRAQPQQATDALRALSRGTMAPKVIEAIVASAGQPSATPMNAAERKMLTRLFEEVVRLHDKCAEVDARIEEVTRAKASWEPMRRMLGATTLAALVALVGDPSQYASASALEKACGLNLKESSSGERQGRGVHITKRGPAVVRRYLYMLALRMVGRQELVRAWYQRRRSFLAEDKLSAVVAVMRKLVRALWHVARGAPFDATKLFDVRRLGVVTALPATRPEEVSAMA